MGANGAPQITMRLSDGLNGSKPSNFRRNGQDRANTRRLRASNDLVTLGRKIGKIEMAMAVYNHRGSITQLVASPSVST